VAELFSGTDTELQWPGSKQSGSCTKLVNSCRVAVRIFMRNYSIFEVPFIISLQAVCNVGHTSHGQPPTFSIFSLVNELLCYGTL
jgi:hypothetical protein